MKFLKRLVKKIFFFYGFIIKRTHKNQAFPSNFDEIYNKIFSKNKKIVIFDIGANKGQSIERFKKIFPNCIIHAFEPIKDEFESLKKKYENDKNVHLNNFAIGSKNEQKKFFINKKSSVSSFRKVNKNTKWLKLTSQEYNVDQSSFLVKEELTKIIKLDYYLQKKKISNVDILKIDTQGFEEEVLNGAKKSFLKNIISIIESEIIFDNVYKHRLSFFDLEKYLLPNSFRFVGIETCNNNLFDGYYFFADVLYVNIKKINLGKYTV